MKKILIVDDEKDILETIVDTLELEFEESAVQSANSGAEALELLAKDKEFSVIITDLNMPRMNGVELIENIRKIGIDSSIIVFTGHGGDVEQERLDSLNIDTMIRKPYIDKLLERVEKILE